MLSQSHVHRFFRHASLAAKKYEDSHVARQEVKEHIRNVREIATRKDADAEEIHRALRVLESKVMDAMDKQSKVIRHVHEEKSFNHQLLQRISSLETHLKKYMEHQEKRAKRIKKIEERMNKKVKKKKPKGPLP
jgi:chromosome segregation ATPase